MRYLITTNQTQPFLTMYFNAENHFQENIKMVVFDLLKRIFTTNGKDWKAIPVDHL
jgi:hypothetical protein